MKHQPMRKLGIAPALALSATLVLPRREHSGDSRRSPAPAPTSRSGGSADTLMAELNDVIADGGSVSDVETLLPAHR